MTAWVEIDGSFGEGGGQILRTAVALSVATQRPIRILNIRAGRTKPGLANQHLTCIKAARQITSATVSGDTLGSQTLVFEPGPVLPGDYSFDVTTAGSVALVFHALFLPLCLAWSESRITIRGGTHVKWSPSYEFLEDQWLFYLRKMGFDISLRLEKAGYYPEGGGVLKAHVKPVKEISPLVLSDRGAFRGVVGRVFFSNLKPGIASRQAVKAGEILHARGLSADIEIREYPSPGVGTGTHLRAAYENGSGSFTSLGERGLPAERVGASSAASVLDYIDSGAAVDRFMADQLLLPLSFASGESFFTCEQVTQHLVTNAHVVQMFLPVRVELDGELGQAGRVRITPRGAKPTGSEC
jgi:RNA 3'-phosphate cyclase